MAKSAKVGVKEDEVLPVAVGETDTENMPSNEYHKVEFQNVMKQIETILTTVKALKNETQRLYTMQTKDLKKLDKGRRRSTGERVATGFSKASAVPVALRKLLDIDESETVPRPEVTKRLYAYIEKHNLRDEGDKRIMRVDDALAKAFGLTPAQVKSINSYTLAEGDKIDKTRGFNFYNIQKHVAALYAGKPLVIAGIEPSKTKAEAKAEVETETDTKRTVKKQK